MCVCVCVRVRACVCACAPVHVVLSLEMDHGGGKLVYVGEQHGLADPNALCQEVSAQLRVGERKGGGEEGGRREEGIKNCQHQSHSSH